MIFSSLPHRAVEEAEGNHPAAAAGGGRSLKGAAHRQAAAYRGHREEVHVFRLAAVADACTALPRA
ncbi:hypothetical protein AA23498_1947 [Acetobacter nitrogenifigens DSM 23921 = NBRC 105050]|uniref:Uncharacterized protein n=1 Tax=Acetobacter nitrogenifigens DSM 23921 = NBRC 105050 TaxID=1120919 RepID=A0A511XC54_9PROT|nr:hypothetical protein AA23498_1947 [Acetobacter nitrogenifigens DSM 23921 = NBRC 105050]GEN60547.1 hypothetical protein ANI02nite_24310 [Acetobacter nitrogenifigens DSM 23921 = NBRC 105050]